MGASDNRRAARVDRALWIEQCGMCWYCERPVSFDAATRDHVHPVSRGGTSRRDNLVIACEPCNQAKANRPTWKTKTPERLAALVKLAKSAFFWRRRNVPRVRMEAA